MSIWVTRSAPDNLNTARRLHRCGHTALMIPVLTAVARSVAPLAGTPDAIVFSSRHAVRHHAMRHGHAGIPVYAAGEAVAQAARDAGYRTVTWSGGDDRALCDFIRHLLPVAGTVAYLCSDRTSRYVDDRLSDQGFAVERHAVYETRAIDLSELSAAHAALGQVEGILVHSVPAAERVRQMVSEHGWRGTIWCISDASAAVLSGLDGVRIVIAARPTEASLIGLVTRETGRRPDTAPPVAGLPSANDN